MPTSILDMPDDDILNLQLVNKRMHSISRLYLSKRVNDVSLQGLQELYSLSFGPCAHHITTLILRMEHRVMPKAKYLTLIYATFRNFANFGKLASIGVRRHREVTHYQSLAVTRKSHSVMVDFLVTRLLRSASRAKLNIRTVVYDFAMSGSQVRD
ncbi:hypothetical protein AUEXF2481DRAFT_7619 [Aureobasidium subglaciale EXF-2481]|uniref:F-box domain-containing protein n=1 Tax=Aureobasidium subglaciale (strain EXF-2481) TaxID=1043005 RepID=A0A074Y421_AURSE|nr:uncharacterized protein AUEXF2481DRAFT_7619 [Aureobasidium subglaciale EXF-2481]KAI5197071.1 hypothetical protein E4T38_08203 [Aureobasidium subglaciale]KAI5215751.1 hypothetical protein E4T40_08213 [Aureobasidium subglaciale]KAI5219024.1 hypothetical protein E4T41_08128 [Aureobasidium subglaciale]KAI5256612.1 hypothetical protein E4T46_08104 [Aureobasidium subglaciale]KEQ92543.1 hypothetical protein AUEXF2481DRAFT_7619 [Aureobasidium subglaciale EXF-2481]